MRRASFRAILGRILSWRRPLVSRRLFRAGGGGTFFPATDRALLFDQALSLSISVWYLAAISSI
jgi:hypothetical protein